jgi:hypothetical protein
MTPTGVTKHPEYGSVTIDPWRSATRHVCSVVGCEAPCTAEPFGWRVRYNALGRQLREPLTVEAFLCEHHETEIGRTMGFRLA